MNERTLEILDQSLKYSLWAFLFIFLASLCFIALRLKARKQGLVDYLRDEFERRHEQVIMGEDLGEVVDGAVPLSNRVRMATKALILSVALAFVCFLLAGFTPLSFFGNFATEPTRESGPLRLTLLTYERFYEGFSLEGEVWNQTQEPMTGLKALVSIWKSEHEFLDEVSVQIDPDPLPALSAGTFNLRYTENSPFLYGYQVTFENEQDREVPHVEGFDVE